MAMEISARLPISEVIEKFDIRLEGSALGGQGVVFLAGSRRYLVCRGPAKNCALQEINEDFECPWGATPEIGLLCPLGTFYDAINYYKHRRAPRFHWQ